MIDLVYTYVNNTDPAWQAKYNQNAPLKRFNFSGEIFFALKSAQYYFNWVRKVFIVHDNQPFDTSFLLPEFAEKIHFIDHQDIIPQNKLPLFSAVAIEAFLHNIPDLADTFTLANDDVFFGKPVDENVFYKNQKIVLYQTPYDHSIYPTPDGYGQMYANTHQIYHNAFPNTNFYLVNSHMIHNFDKQIFKQTIDAFATQIEDLTNDHYRTNPNAEISVPTLVASEMLRLNRAECCTRRDPTIEDLTAENYEMLITQRPQIFSINGLTPDNPFWEAFQAEYFT